MRVDCQESSCCWDGGGVTRCGERFIAEPVIGGTYEVRDGINAWLAAASCANGWSVDVSTASDGGEMNRHDGLYLLLQVIALIGVLVVCCVVDR